MMSKNLLSMKNIQGFEDAIESYKNAKEMIKFANDQKTEAERIITETLEKIGVKSFESKGFGTFMLIPKGKTKRLDQKGLKISLLEKGVQSNVIEFCFKANTKESDRESYLRFTPVLEKPKKSGSNFMDEMAL